MKVVKKVPKSAFYLYSTDDGTGRVSKVYRSNAHIYLVFPDQILSCSFRDLKSLSLKLINAYGQFENKNK